MTTNAISSSHSRPRLSFKGIFKAISVALEVQRQRNQLIGLSDHMLKDIGLTRAEAHREARRPFKVSDGLTEI